MIDYIKGEIAELSPTNAVIELGGVGYYINITPITYAALQGQQTAKLFVHEAIREDAYVLYGFPTQSERALFLQLISVSGVGAGTARTILSTLSAEELQQAIASGNASTLQHVKGIGLKTAQRIIVDLKDKIGAVSESNATMVAVASGSGILQNEAEQALSVLGYPPAMSRKILQKILHEKPQLTVEQLIKEALHRL